MRILIEGYPYEEEMVKNLIQSIEYKPKDGKVFINYVGYFYNPSVDDCVFILPKVLLKDNGEHEVVFDNKKPEEITKLNWENLNELEKKFIREFAIWVYRAIMVFWKKNPNNTIVSLEVSTPMAGKGSRRKAETHLDILLGLIQFNLDNQDFFFFILRNLHSGYNKINWTRTISKTNAIVQDNIPIYLNPVNKKRQINFDEELLVIYFSILNYIGDHYGFSKKINCNFDLIKGERFEAYINNIGKTRLLQIKYKYFSDKALELWELCYAFFDSEINVRTNSDRSERLLVKNFNIVFESIIDELIGDKEIPRGLKEQEDGKLVDHMYTYKWLTTNEDDKLIYYIGDSKYYKRSNPIGRKSIYKQFTYARNVIQWNLNLFMKENPYDEENEEKNWNEDQKRFKLVPKLRDDFTEGYNIVPNFFISARLNEDFNYDSEIKVSDKDKPVYINQQFENRLFDRDTLLVCHYDVNFLYVVSLYARDNSLLKAEWKEYVRRLFRMETQRMLNDKFKFYVIMSHPGKDGKAYIKDHFQEVLGKIFAPYATDKILSLALEKEHEENNNLLEKLRKNFYVVECKLGENAITKFKEAIKLTTITPSKYTTKNGVLMVMFRNYNEQIARISHNNKFAIGIEYNRESLKIVENMQSIGYVLFHNQDCSEQRMYVVEGNCVLKNQKDLEKDRVKYRKDVEFHVAIDLDFYLSSEDFIYKIRAKKIWSSKYDTRFTTLESLDIYRV